jgi:hypothetical protein
MLPVLPLALIHPSAWNKNSAKFATASNTQVTTKIVPRGGCAAPCKPCKLPTLANGAGV